MNRQLSALFQENAPALFKKAQELAKQVPTLFTTPITYTTFCQTNPPCHHCFWRSQSHTNPYFAHKTTSDEAINIARKAAESGIKRILIPSGCIGHELPQAYYEHVAGIKDTACKINPDIEFFAICGHLSKQSLLNLKSAGLTGYFCSMEIPNERLFRKVRPGDDFRARMQTIEDTHAIGLKVWSGFLYGLGETKIDIIHAMNYLEQFNLDSISIMPFQQYPFVELEKRKSANLYDWAKVTAIARLWFGKINVYTKPDYANWGFIGGANATVPIMMKDAAAKQTDELAHMREATYNVKLNKSRKK